MTFISREVGEDVELTLSNNSSFLLLKKGTTVQIPLWEIHHDPNIWPEPEQFRPERFAKKEKLFHPMAFIPFGAGMRSCVGVYFWGLLGSIVSIFRRFR